MRIGVDATVLETPQPTGIGTFTINILNALSALHSNTTIWTIEKSLLQQNKAEIKQIFPKARTFAGNNISYLRAWWTQYRLPHLIRKSNIDVFFSPIPEGIISPPIPQVVTVHDVTPLIYKQQVPYLRHLSFRHRLPKVLKSSARIAVVSESVRNDVMHYYGIDPERIDVVSEGFDSNHFYPREDSAELSKILNSYNLTSSSYFIYVGSIAPTKNLIHLIDAFSNAFQHDSSLSMVIAGKTLDERYLAQLYEYTERMKIRNIRFLHYVPYTHLPHLISGALGLLLVSLYEGFGLPTLEAMACGTPVIASNRGSLPEVVEKAGILVDPLNTEETAHAIRLLAESSDLRLALREKGLRRAQLYSWERAAEKVLAACSSAMSGT